MNTVEQTSQLYNKLHSILDGNKGVVNLIFHDGKKVTANMKSANSNISHDKIFVCTITVFTKDINDTTTYDMHEVKDIS